MELNSELTNVVFNYYRWGIFEQRGGNFNRHAVQIAIIEIKISGNKWEILHEF